MRFQVLARAVAKGVTREDRQVVARSRRMSRIRTSVEALQARVKRDLRSSDPDRFLTALAVGLMAETNEDPVYSWRKRNVHVEDRQAHFRSKGKRKPITNAALVMALEDAYEAVEDGDDELFAHSMGRVTAERVNDYLAGFKLNMKDIRSSNASRVMSGKLSEVRASGPELPRHKRSRTKLLQGEFFKALEATAEEVGLEAEMIRYDCLDPGMEASYLESGGLEKMASVDSLVNRVALRFQKILG